MISARALRVATAVANGALRTHAARSPVAQDLAHLTTQKKGCRCVAHGAGYLPSYGILSDTE